MYVEELEARVRELEKQNIKLQNLLSAFQKQKSEFPTSNSKDLMNEVKLHKKTISDIYITKDGKYNEEAKVPLVEHYLKNSPKILGRHTKFLEDCFNQIINNFYPV
mmetsp:Transcript_30734/g.27184  ORF Transcript_30734/g.27184 Transcript_30734/m.27184 type:complete len:106 (+) Transcript_30734:128-445(+)